MEGIVEQSAEIAVMDNLSEYAPEPCVGGNAGDALADPVAVVGDSTFGLGTFKDASEVYQAYEELRKDYTRRCQELALLKNSNASVAAQEPITKSDDDVVREYLFGVSRRTHAPVVMGQAVTGNAVPDAPKSLNSATKIAQQFFGGKL